MKRPVTKPTPGRAVRAWTYASWRDDSAGYGALVHTEKRFADDILVIVREARP